MMEYSVGAALALLGLGLAAVVGLGRERAFYPTILIWIASYYLLFALMGGDTRTLVLESLFMAIFLLLALAGYKTSLWLVAAALAGHGVFDFFHASLVDNPGVPTWWPGFCLAFDVAAGAFLAVLLARKPRIADGRKVS